MTKISAVADVPLLSICIPTYNQPEHFRQTLLSVLPQLSPEVELIIQDDSSNDETESFVREQTKRFSLQYVHGVKQGVDRALLILLGRARGKYIWWLGDDLVTPGTISRILSTLAVHPDITFMVLNCRGHSAEEPEFRFGHNFFFRDRDEVLERIADLLGFISIIVFDRARAVSGMQGARDFINSAWVSLYTFLHVLAASGRYYFFDELCIVSGDERRPDQDSWYDSFSVFAVNLHRVVTSFSGRFRQSSIRKMLAINFSGIWRGILVHRAKGYTKTGLGSKSSKIPILFKLYWNFPAFWVALPFLLTPRPVLRWFYRLYKLVVPHTRHRVG